MGEIKLKYNDIINTDYNALIDDLTLQSKYIDYQLSSDNFSKHTLDINTVDNFPKYKSDLPEFEKQLEQFANLYTSRPNEPADLQEVLLSKDPFVIQNKDYYLAKLSLPYQTMHPGGINSYTISEEDAYRYGEKHKNNDSWLSSIFRDEGTGGFNIGRGNQEEYFYNRFVKNAPWYTKTIDVVGKALYNVVDLPFDVANSVYSGIKAAVTQKNFFEIANDNFIKSWLNAKTDFAKDLSLTGDYKPTGYDNMSLTQKMATHQWLSTSFADGAGFALQFAIPGAIFAKIPALSRTVKGLSTVSKFLTGSEKVGYLAGYGFNTFSEAILEGEESWKDNYEKLIKEGYGINDAISKSNSSAEKVFGTNLLILGVSNVLTSRLVNSIIDGASSRLFSGATTVATENIGKTATSKGVSNFFSKQSLLNAFGKDKQLGQLFTKSAFGRNALTGVASLINEGFVEENFQLAAARKYNALGKYVTTGPNGSTEQSSDRSIFSIAAQNIADAWNGLDGEAAESIALGGIIGSGMSLVEGVSQSKRDAREYRDNKQRLDEAYGNVFTSIRDENGEIDEAKRTSLVNAINFLESKVSFETDPLSDPKNRIINNLHQDSIIGSLIYAHYKNGSLKGFKKNLKLTIEAQTNDMFEKLGYDENQIQLLSDNDSLLSDSLSRVLTELNDKVDLVDQLEKVFKASDSVQFEVSKYELDNDGNPTTKRRSKKSIYEEEQQLRAQAANVGLHRLLVNNALNKSIFEYKDVYSQLNLTDVKLENTDITSSPLSSQEPKTLLEIQKDKEQYRDVLIEEYTNSIKEEKPELSENEAIKAATDLVDNLYENLNTLKVTSTQLAKINSAANTLYKIYHKSESKENLEKYVSFLEIKEKLNKRVDKLDRKSLRSINKQKNIWIKKNKPTSVITNEDIIKRLTNIKEELIDNYEFNSDVNININNATGTITLYIKGVEVKQDIYHVKETLSDEEKAYNQDIIDEYLDYHKYYSSYLNYLNNEYKHIYTVFKDNKNYFSLSDLIKVFLEDEENRKILLDELENTHIYKNEHDFISQETLIREVIKTYKRDKTISEDDLNTLLDKYFKDDAIKSEFKDKILDSISSGQSRNEIITSLEKLKDYESDAIKGDYITDQLYKDLKKLFIFIDPNISTETIDEIKEYFDKKNKKLNDKINKENEIKDELEKKEKLESLSISNTSNDPNIVPPLSNNNTVLELTGPEINLLINSLEKELLEKILKTNSLDDIAKILGKDGYIIKGVIQNIHLLAQKQIDTINNTPVVVNNPTLNKEYIKGLNKMNNIDDFVDYVNYISVNKPQLTKNQIDKLSIFLSNLKQEINKKLFACK